jgi:hypothetical protein
MTIIQYWSSWCSPLPQRRWLYADLLKPCGIHGIRQHAMVAQPSLAFENRNALNFQW